MIRNAAEGGVEEVSNGVPQELEETGTCAQSMTPFGQEVGKEGWTVTKAVRYQMPKQFSLELNAVIKANPDVPRSE